MKDVQPPIFSTCISDSLVTHCVESVSDLAVGIYGFYHSEFEAHRVAKFLRENGHTHVTVNPFDPKDHSGYKVKSLLWAIPF